MALGAVYAAHAADVEDDFLVWGWVIACQLCSRGIFGFVTI
jgi:hypothetical protein